MTESMIGGVGLGDDLGEVRWKIGVDDIKGGGDYVSKGCIIISVE